jgi:hypothetical protein
MAYVQGFEFDLFISYAHVDDLTAESGAKGWVTQFYENLEIALWKRAGRADSVRIWRDIRKIDGSQLFNKTIEDGVRSSALFVALTSSGYLESDYCRKELDYFRGKAANEPQGLAVGDRPRIFNVLLNNIPHQKWPSEFAGSSGFPFNDAQRDDDSGEPVPPENKELFPRRLRELADAIFRTLTELKNAGNGSAAGVAAPNAGATAGSSAAQPGAFTIYVADTADSLSSARKRLVNELQQQSGLQVVASIPPPYEAGPHEQQVTSELKKASLSIHLLDALAGREIEGHPGLYYPQAQADLALTHSRSPFIWVPQQLDADAVDDEGYKKFLTRLESGSREQRPFDFVRGSPSTLVREVLDKVAEIKARAATEDAPAAALLDTHLKDQLYALELGRFLLNNKVQPYINPEEDDPRKNLNLFAERLKQVSLLIIFFGSVAEEWVRARLAAALQIAITENCPLKACGVYIAPPRKASSSIQLGQKLIPIELMDNSEGFNAGSVTNLLERMKQVSAQ